MHHELQCWHDEINVTEQQLVFSSFYHVVYVHVVSNFHSVYVQMQYSIHQTEISVVTYQCYEAVDHLSDQFKMTWCLLLSILSASHILLYELSHLILLLSLDLIQHQHSCHCNDDEYFEYIIQHVLLLMIAIHFQHSHDADECVSILIVL